MIFLPVVALALFWAAVACAFLGDWRACVGCLAGVYGCVLLVRLEIDHADAA